MDEHVVLHDDDLVDDRELEQPDEDKLNHGGVVDQLAKLVATVDTPSNIALYGPWGSGKTGISNLLKKQIRSSRKTRFVRFDAFKYADVPLRRNFISAVASELKLTGDRYHVDLYSDHTKSDISVPAGTFMKTLWLFIKLLLSVVLILGGLVALVALVQPEEFGVVFPPMLLDAVVAGLVPAGLLSALVAMANRNFSVDRSVSKPESDEQFEQLFKSLVQESNAERLVIFVDELDRCSADEVVTTLDTIRTFLGISKCIFIIAADRNVLEEALTIGARQETPSNEVNPYYSTGSAYLDKVFQYQIDLPPLLAQSVRQFAQATVVDRSGLWSELNTRHILSILIPSHVQSPRRVKHLLNTFALTFRLAEARYRSGVLAENPREAAAGIARWVCMRVEFPLFARNLELDPRLPDYVLRLVQDPTYELSENVSPVVAERARKYACDDAAPAAMLVDRNEEKGNTGQQPTSSATTVSHNKQLHNYLVRTQQVPGPSRDIIFMQSSGTMFGLDGAVAHSIERAAEDINVESLVRQFSALEDDSKESALEVLAHQIRVADELIASNTAQGFLQLTAALPDLDVTSVRDDVIAGIFRLDVQDVSVLQDSNIESVWKLSKASSEKVGHNLQARIVDLIVEAAIFPDFLFEDILLALERSEEGLTNHLASALVSSSGPSIVRRIFESPDIDVVSVLDRLRTPLANHFSDTVPVEGELPEELSGSLSFLNEMSVQVATRETAVQHTTISVLLACDHEKSRSAVESLLPKTERLFESNTIMSLLGSVPRRKAQLWHKWLQAIKVEAIDQSHAGRLSSLVATLWEKTAAGEDTSKAIDAVLPLVAYLPTEVRPDITSNVIENIALGVQDSGAALEQRKLLDQVERFVALGVVDEDSAYEKVHSSLQETLAQPLGILEHEDELYKFIKDAGQRVLRNHANSFSDDDSEKFLKSIVDSPLLDTFQEFELLVVFAPALGQDVKELKYFPSAGQLTDLIETYGAKIVPPLGAWVRLSFPDPASFGSIIEVLISTGIDLRELSDAVEEIHATWYPAEHLKLVERYVRAAETELPSRQVASAIGLAKIEDSLVAGLIIARFDETTNNQQRTQVIELWKMAEVRSEVARRKLIEQVVYPLLALNHNGTNMAAAEIGIDGIKVCGGPIPHGVKGSLKERVKEAIKVNSKLGKKQALF